MSEENEVPSEPTEEDKEWAVKLWDVLHKPGEENPRIKLARALSALRAEWEKEKGELERWVGELQSKLLIEAGRWSNENLEKRALEAEKKGLEERVRELEAENYRLKLEPSYTEGFKDCRLNEVEPLKEELDRLKAENERLLTSQTATFLNGFRDEVTSMAKTIHKQEEKIDSLTLALAEARDSLEGVIRVADRETVEFQVARKALTNPTSQRASEEMKRLREIEARMKGLENGISGKIAEYFDASTKCLKDSYLLASSEEMKGLRKVVEAARLSNKECRKWRSNPDEKPCHEFKSLVDNDLLCHGCRLMNRIEALEAYESRGKVCEVDPGGNVPKIKSLIAKALTKGEGR